MKIKTFILTFCLLYVIPLWSVQAQWREVKKLLASDGDKYDYFGHSVSISGNQAIAGAPGEGSGMAYIFARNTTGRWQEVAKLTPSDGDTGDAFGHAVSMSGNRVIVGANTDDDLGTHAGRVCVYF